MPRGLGKKGHRLPLPGEGQGRVADILKDAFAHGYDGGISIEPHMAVVFHDANSKTSNEEAMRQNFVDYGRRLEEIIREVKPRCGGGSPAR